MASRRTNNLRDYDSEALEEEEMDEMDMDALLDSRHDGRMSEMNTDNRTFAGSSRRDAIGRGSTAPVSGGETKLNQMSASVLMPGTSSGLNAS